MMKDWYTHMVIAPHLIHNKKYAGFYTSNRHIYTMLDNGLWEGEVVSNQKLIMLAEMINANEIIAPDHKSAKISIRRTTKFLDYIGKDRVNYIIHGAIHGKNYNEQLKCLNKLMELDIDVFDMPKMVGPENRYKLCMHLASQLKDPQIHFLGYYKEEWDTLVSGSTIRSFDTSVPFKPRYDDKFQLDLPFTYWNYLKFKYRTDKWKKMFYRWRIDVN